MRVELSVKYQYTYFLYPYTVETSKYQKYILKLLKNNKCRLKIFEKEKDLDIYNYFNTNIRNTYMYTFEFRNKRLKEFLNMNIDKQSKIISEQPCAIFEYDISEYEDIKEFDKRKKENIGILFNVSKIEIICFNTGICFISLKTNIENSENFSDLLNFNYKFREMYSEFNSLKQYENININTNSFESIEEIKEVIEEIAGEREKNNVMLTKQKFYTFAYACIQNEHWNEKVGFENLENEFLKYVNVFPSNHLTDLNKKSDEQNVSIISKLKYVRTGITNTSCNVLASTVDMYNYTKLPYEYENQIYYTYILRLYQKIFLNQINMEFKSYDKIIRIRKEFINFAKSLWVKDVTTDDTGSLYYRVIKNRFELDDLFEEIRKKYEIIYKDLKIEKNNRDNTIIVMLLILSLILNTFSIITYLYLM